MKDFITEKIEDLDCYLKSKKVTLFENNFNEGIKVFWKDYSEKWIGIIRGTVSYVCLTDTRSEDLSLMKTIIDSKGWERYRKERKQEKNKYDHILEKLKEIYQEYKNIKIIDETYDGDYFLRENSSSFVIIMEQALLEKN